MSVVRAVVSGERVGFEYFVIRCVPRVDRGESINVGVVLHSQMADFLAAKTILDVDRLRMLDPDVDAASIQAALATIEAVCRGEDAVGPASGGTRSERFGWLSAPRSTMLQPGPVHGGLTDLPGEELQRLVTSLVLR